MTLSLRRLAYGFVAAFTLIAVFTGYWSLISAEALTSREDNPRLVLNEQRIRRGTIYDHNGEILAESLVDPVTGIATRLYPYNGFAPIVGYYSIRYGRSGIEDIYDYFLSGYSSLTISQRLERNVLHRPQVGGDIRLTVDLVVQQAAVAALDGYTGAVVVLREGDVLALASTPGFDPNNLDDLWDELSIDPQAPLLNRATQGLYQPGTILQPVILGAALNYRTASPEDPRGDALTVRIDGALLGCSGDATTIETLGDAFTSGCPAPFVHVAESLGAARLGTALSDFGLLQPPQFALPTAGADIGLPFDADTLWLTAVGQSNLTVTPLQMALVAAALANNGQMPALRIVEALRSPGGMWREVTPTSYPHGVISRDNALLIASLMDREVRTGAAQTAAVSGYHIYGHAGLAVSGPEPTYSAWFIGFAENRSGAPISVAVILEETPSAVNASQVGGQVLNAALDTHP
jgi:peptidoglycan glycosyltransferase